MGKLFFLIFFLLAELNALGLDELVSKALEKNNSLKAIQHKLSAISADVEASNQFANPTFAYNTNTLDNSEKMSTQTLSFGQKIYFYSKRDTHQEIYVAKKDVLNENLLKAKVSLVNAIKNQAYSVWELEKLYGVILDYESLTKQNIELSESYTSTSDNQHMGIMSAELALSNLRIQKSMLAAKIKVTYSKLSALASFKIDKLSLEIGIDEMLDKSRLRRGLLNNNNILIKEKELKESQALLDYARLSNYPDINFLASYSHRENFDDFSTFGFGITLPIYGVEDSKEEAARSMVLSAQSLKEDTKTAIDSEFESAYAQMNSQYEIYHIIHDEAMPQINHMFELINSNISAGGDLFKYIDILGQKLKLEQKSIAAIAEYNRARAKISALSGEMR